MRKPLANLKKKKLNCQYELLSKLVLNITPEMQTQLLQFTGDCGNLDHQGTLGDWSHHNALPSEGFSHKAAYNG